MGLIKVGMIGLDTSHASIFSNVLHDTNNPYYHPGVQVTTAYPGGSPDFERSFSRVDGFVKELAEKYGVQMVGTPEEVAERCDAIMLLSVDGRVHLEQFRRIMAFRKPVFIDKPFAVSTPDAEEIVRLAEENGITIMSSSSLRYAQGLTDELQRSDEGSIIGADCSGPLPMEPTQPGLFWYGIHTVEMLYRVMGMGCVQVGAATTELHDVVTGVWADGRIGVIRGNRAGNDGYGLTIYREQANRFVNLSAHPKPFYASLVEKIMDMFATGRADVPLQETLEIVRFIEAANVARETGETVKLSAAK